MCLDGSIGLQLYWIPIRDWNNVHPAIVLKDQGCNYIESLLGIETGKKYWIHKGSRCCNYIESLLGIETQSWIW